MIASVLLGLLATGNCDPQPWVINATNHCSGSVQSAEFTQYNSVAAATACGAACAASVIAITAAGVANVTACGLVTAQANTACSGNPDICTNADSVKVNACAEMLKYVNASTEDSISQTFAACNASVTGTTACNAAFSGSYISCNVAHASDYIACNDALLVFAGLCLASGASEADCSDALVDVKATCQSSAALTHSSCLSSADAAHLLC